MSNTNTPAQVVSFPLARFEVGKSYSCRSAGDYDCKWSFEVIARTEKSVTLKGDFCSADKIQVKRIKIRDGAEFVRPLGVYSLAPFLRAA